jgi:hypothetical protein
VSVSESGSNFFDVSSSTLRNAVPYVLQNTIRAFHCFRKLNRNLAVQVAQAILAFLVLQKRKNRLAPAFSPSNQMVKPCRS